MCFFIGLLVRISADRGFVRIPGHGFGGFVLLLRSSLVGSNLIPCRKKTQGNALKSVYSLRLGEDCVLVSICTNLRSVKRRLLNETAMKMVHLGELDIGRYALKVPLGALGGDYGDFFPQGVEKDVGFVRIRYFGQFSLSDFLIVILFLLNDQADERLERKEELPDDVMG
jgi:hypothetical protein